MHKTAWPASATLLTLAVAALLLAPAAQAQAPAAEWDLALEAALPDRVRPDSTTPASWHVTVTGQGMVCSSDHPITVSIEASGSGVDGVFLEVPPQLNATVPMGAYLLEPFTLEIPVDAVLLAARFAEQGASGTIQVSAVLDASGNGCVPAPESAPGDSAELPFEVEVVPEGDPLFHPSHEMHGGAVDAYLAPGESFTYRFRDHGAFSYHDHIDPGRKGSVTVTEDTEAGDHQVTIGPSGYDPADLVVGIGSNVTWTNQDESTRTVSFDELHGGEETDHGHGDHGHADHGHDGEAARTPAPGTLVAGIVLAALAAARRHPRATG